MNKVFPTGGKKFICLCFLGFLLIFSQSVAAQTEKRERNFLAELPTKSSKIKIKSQVETSEKKSDFADPVNFPKAFQKSLISKENLSEDNGDNQTTEKKPIAASELQISDFVARFRLIDKRKRPINFEDSTNDKRENKLILSKAKDEKNSAVADDSIDDASVEKQGFQWKSAIGQSLLFLGVQHGYAIGFQAKTRRDLKHGAFFRDYANSVKALHGWDDGGRFFTNYIAHPLQGAMTGFIYVQNNPKERKLEFNESSAYWRSRMKALAWSAAWSTQFEIGPISQASIGNVGLHGKQTWEDIVVTPTMGTAMLITEDAIDRFITKRIERNTNNFYVKIFARMLLSPTRNFSNMIRFKQPWYRDRSAE